MKFDTITICYNPICWLFQYVGIPQRIPSPRELQFHTQAIMQNALIKKKLEDQRENFRKRQEGQPSSIAMNSKGMPNMCNSVVMCPDGIMWFNSLDINNEIQMSHHQQQQQASRGPASPNSMTSHKPMNQSPTPTLAFTPTSVLRKMTIASSGTNIIHNVHPR